MRKLLPLLIAFLLGMLVEMFICTATFRHISNQGYLEIIGQLEQEKTWLGQKIASLVLEISPDLRDSGKEILVSWDGSVEVRERGK